MVDNNISIIINHYNKSGKNEDKGVKALKQIIIIIIRIHHLVLPV